MVRGLWLKGKGYLVSGLPKKIITATAVAKKDTSLASVITANVTVQKKKSENQASGTEGKTHRKAAKGIETKAKNVDIVLEIKNKTKRRTRTQIIQVLTRVQVQTRV